MLRIKIQVNNEKPLIDLAAVRINPEHPKIGDICTYRINKLYDVEEIGLMYDPLFTIKYKYGDATKLTQKILTKYTRLKDKYENNSKKV